MTGSLPRTRAAKRWPAETAPTEALQSFPDRPKRAAVQAESALLQHFLEGASGQWGRDHHDHGVEQATEMAIQASTRAEFGKALKHLMRVTGRTQGGIVSHSDKNGKWLSKSTVSRMVNGATLGRHKEQVEAFVEACGVALLKPVWAYARELVRDRCDQRNQPTATLPDAPPYEQPAESLTVSESFVDDSLNNTATDVVLDVHIRITCEDIRKAGPMLLAMTALCPDDANLLTGHRLATMALFLSAGYALLTHAKRAVRTTTDTIGDVTCPPVTADLSHVCVTTPRNRTA